MRSINFTDGFLQLYDIKDLFNLDSDWIQIKSIVRFLKKIRGFTLKSNISPNLSLITWNLRYRRHEAQRGGMAGD